MLDEHCCYFLRPGCVLVGGHRDLRSLGITDCPGDGYDGHAL